jgi:3-hydroxyisobutyrate dehydrogenase-like beta-hydroxyacid dehydrogenase
MGAAIARTLLAGGNSVTVWNRTPGKAEELARGGASVAASVREALEASPVTLVVVVGYDVVWELVGGSGAELSRCDVVNFSSGTPGEAVELAARFDEAGGHLLEGCLLGYPSSIGTDDMMIKYSGDRGAWDRSRQLLRPLAGLTDYAGEGPALANVFDAASLAFYTSCTVAMLEASAYAQREGLTFDQLEPALHVGTGVLDDFITRAGAKIPAGDFAVEDSALSTYLAALEGVVAAMQTAQASSGVVTATRDAMRAGVERGRGDDDLFVLHEVLSKSQEGGS